GMPLFWAGLPSSCGERRPGPWLGADRARRVPRPGRGVHPSRAADPMARPPARRHRDPARQPDDLHPARDDARAVDRPVGRVRLDQPQVTTTEPATTFRGRVARFDVLVPPPADGSTRARLGPLELPHGGAATPAFMAVGANATVKALHPDDLREVGASIVLANTYHLYLRPGHERIARLGGLHRFMAWNRPILTDSGGFQVVSLGDLRVVDDDGATF